MLIKEAVNKTQSFINGSVQRYYLTFSMQIAAEAPVVEKNHN